MSFMSTKRLDDTLATPQKLQHSVGIATVAAVPKRRMTEHCYSLPLLEEYGQYKGRKRRERWKTSPGEPVELEPKHTHKNIGNSKHMSDVARLLYLACVPHFSVQQSGIQGALSCNIFVDVYIERLAGGRTL